MQDILILGTYSFAEEVADLIAEIPEYRVTGFVENMERARCDETLEGLPIIWVDSLPQYAKSHRAVCALATTFRSRFTNEAAGHGVQFATVVHPSARVSPTSSLGEGSIVSAGVIVGSRTSIGRHVILNRGALVGHHTEIADYVSIMPGANIAGRCRVGEGTYVGMGAVVIDNITIGANSVVGAGAVVTRNVPDNVQVLGLPARIVKENIEGK